MAPAFAIDSRARSSRRLMRSRAGICPGCVMNAQSRVRGASAFNVACARSSRVCAHSRRRSAFANNRSRLVIWLSPVCDSSAQAVTCGPRLARGFVVHVSLMHGVDNVADQPGILAAVNGRHGCVWTVNHQLVELLGGFVADDATAMN